MFQIYVFFLLLCGGLAALSVVGDFLDTDVGDVEGGFDGDVDLGADVDAGTDVDVAVELDGTADAGPGGSAEGGVDTDAEKIFSIRGGLYAGFGFGLVGTLLTLLGSPAGSPLTIALAAGSGLGAGWIVTRLLNWIRSTEAGQHAADSTFEGRTGRMTLPITDSANGRVRVRRGTRTHDLRALPHPSVSSARAPDEWKEVVVVEVREGVALVAPMEADAFDDLQPEP